MRIENVQKHRNTLKNLWILLDNLLCCVSICFTLLLLLAVTVRLPFIGDYQLLMISSPGLSDLWFGWTTYSLQRVYFRSKGHHLLREKFCFLNLQRRTTSNIKLDNHEYFRFLDILSVAKLDNQVIKLLFLSVKQEKCLRLPLHKPKGPKRP